MTAFKVPLIIRGRIIEGDDVAFGGRGGDASFTAPDVGRYLGELPLSPPSALADLYQLNFDEILDYLERLSERLTLNNPHLMEAYELSCETSGLGASILRATYDGM